MPKFPPREGDLPKDELVAQALQIRANPSSFMPHIPPEASVDVFFRATCPECGTRGMFETPNTTFDSMECCACGHTFPFVVGGLTLKFVI